MTSKRIALAVLPLLTALVFFCMIQAVPAAALETQDVLINERVSVPSDGEAHAFIFSPTANNVYAFQSFGEGRAHAVLTLMGEEEPIAEADGFAFEARLIADATYQLRVTSAGEPVEVEIMRAALGRSFSQPINLTDLTIGYDKVIARAYDTHWYRFIADASGLTVIRSASPINTVGILLDEQGNRLALSDNLYSPYSLDFRIQAALTAGRPYILRVSGRGEETGAYHLTFAMQREGQPLPTALTAQPDQLSLEAGEQASVAPVFAPENALNDVVYLSADPEIATVDAEGLVTACAPGETFVILTGSMNTEARVPVTVVSVPVTGIAAAQTAYELSAGETLSIGYEITPERASERGVTLESDNPGVVRIERSGQVRALTPGTARVTLKTVDGGYSAAVDITVTRAKSTYRALVMGEQRYDDGRVRIGSINTTQGLADLLSRQRYGGERGYEVTMKLDSTRAEAVSAIRTAFKDAQPTDVSLVSINCHGGLTGTLPWLEFHDGSRLTVAQLQRELKKIPGRVVLLLDCCQSGAFLDARDAARFNDGVIRAFSRGDSRLLSSKFLVMASSSAEQDSYRISTSGKTTENDMATVFARSLCEAGGWDLIGDRATKLRADLNMDQVVTFQEAYRYVHRSVNHYLAKRGVRQDVQVYPEGSQFVLFDK